MSPFALVAVLMSLVALAGWLNAMTVKLPHAVAMLLAGLIGAGIVFLVQVLTPGLKLTKEIAGIVSGIDFTTTVTGYMLGFLLFAGAMQVDLTEMRRRWFSIGALATFGVAGSIIVVGFGLWIIARLLGIPLHLDWALVFGALISPTDPVALMATMRTVKISQTLTVLLQGEALFNDGVGIVAFTALVAIANGGEAHIFSTIGDIAIEGVGGLALGMIASTIVIRLMDMLDDFAVEVSLSIALAMAVYAGAQALHLSAPIAAVGAGMLFGSQRARKAMSGETEAYLKSFWTLVDEVLNALLFLLLGVEMLVVPFFAHESGLLLAAIPLVLIARFVVVVPWGAYYRFAHRERGATFVLGFGGLHGAVSLALALSLPDGPERTLLLAVTYAVVAFSIAVQGLSFGPVVKRVTA